MPTQNQLRPLTRSILLTDATGKSKTKIKTVIDTGSAVSLISFDKVSNMPIETAVNAPKLQGAFDSGGVEVIGQVVLYLLADGVRKPIKFYVVDQENFQCIIGWPTIDKLKLELSHKGVFTEERRLLGTTVADDVMLVKTIPNSDSGGIKVYNITMSKLDRNSAIDLGAGVFEEAHNGSIAVKEGIDPKITHNFLASPDLVAAPSTRIRTEKSEKIKAIAEAFDKNKFEIDPRIPGNIKAKIRDILMKYCECVSIRRDEIGNIPTWVEEFTQEFTVNEPIPCKVHPVNPKKADFICGEIESLIKMGVVEETKTQVITSNLLAVPKKWGK